MKSPLRALAKQRPALGLALLCLLLTAAAAHAQVRTWPDTTYGIVVFNDQLDTAHMSVAQFKFAAQHYAGCQKILRDAARTLRTYNPDFLVLHYRLGQGLGHSVPSGCGTTNTYIQIIDGNSWVQEWPGDSIVQPSWFYTEGGSRVFNCDFGYYLMDLDDSGWRTWWSGKVVQQIQDNEDDGLFADSYSIPNYLTPDWNPPLPEPGLSATFESDWAASEHAFTDYMEGVFAGRWKWIPNLGEAITSIDPSDWSNVDGAMIEGFAEAGAGAYYSQSDWELQMDRVLSLVGAGKIVIAQSYPTATNVTERMFILGSYLLIKGAHTYINMDIGTMPEWFPEYGIDLGAPLGSLPTQISDLYRPTGVYSRDYTNGHVYVNPSATPITISLGGVTHKKAVITGGGFVPSTGVPTGSLTYASVTSVSVPPYGAVIVLNAGTGCILSCSASVPTSGSVGKLLSFNATATATGCGGLPSYSWAFGDGATATGAQVTHAYSAAGTYPWVLSVTAGGKLCSHNGSVKVTVPATAPVVSSMTKLGGPFRIVVAGSRLQNGITVAINGTLWTNVTWVSTSKIVINGGAALKAAVPRSTPKTFTFTNPDATSTTKTWSWS